MKFSWLVRMWGLSAMLAFSLVMIATFLMAYISPAKAVMVLINDYNEANLELAIIITAIPCIIYTWYTYLGERAKEI
jgi:heme/copper-type cytochrome/quinol oxidase subunit 2